jgi:hypothetical protein
MSSFISFASGGSPVNINTSYEYIGITSVGAATALTSGIANTKGLYTTLTASTSADIAGFWLLVNTSNGSGNRYLIDIATGAALSEVVLVPDVYSQPGTVGAGDQVVFIPLNIAAGTRISARCQCNGATGTVNVAIIGEVRTANHPPLYNSCERVSSTPAGSPQATTPSNTDITAVTTAATGWTEINASTARTYGALVAIAGIRVSGTAPTTAQSVSLRLATGAAASEVLFAQTSTTVATANPAVPRWPGLPIYKSIPSGTRISGEVLAGTAGASDIFSPLVLGFY